MTPEEKAMRAEQLRKKARAQELRARSGSTQVPQEQPQVPEADSSEAAIQGLGQGATFGYLPELQAKAQEPMRQLFNLAAKNKFLAEKMGVPQGGEIAPQSEEQALQEFQQRDLALQQGAPLAYGAGALGGALAVPIPGLGAGKALQGAGKLAKLAVATGKGAVTGGVMGGVQNVPIGTPSLSEDPVANLKQRLEQAKTGAMFGGVIGGAAEGVSQLAGKVKDAAKKIKEYTAIKQMGGSGQTGKIEKLYSQKGKIEKLTNLMDEQGMLMPGKTTEDVLNKANSVVDDTGKQIGATYKKIASELPEGGVNLENAAPDDIMAFTKNQLDPQSFGDELLDQARQKLDIGEIDENAYRALRTEVNRLKKHGGGIEEFLRYRKSLDDRLGKIYKKGPGVDLSDKEEALLSLRQATKERMDGHIDALDKISNSKNTETLKKLNELYSLNKDLQNVSQKYVIKGKTKNLAGIPELVTGLGGTIYGASQGDDPLEAAARGLAYGTGLGLMRKYGPAATFYTAKKLEQMKAPVGQGTVLKGAVIPWTLMNRKSGENNGNN